MTDEVKEIKSKEVRKLLENTKNKYVQMSFYHNFNGYGWILTDDKKIIKYIDDIHHRWDPSSYEIVHKLNDRDFVKFQDFITKEIVEKYKEYPEIIEEDSVARVSIYDTSYTPFKTFINGPVPGQVRELLEAIAENKGFTDDIFVYIKKKRKPS